MRRKDWPPRKSSIDLSLSLNCDNSGVFSLILLTEDGKPILTEDGKLIYRD